MNDSKKWEALRVRHEEDGINDLAAHLMRLDWSRDQIVAARAEGLSTLLRTAVARSSWHRARLGSLDLESITEADITSLPTMSKDDLMDHFNEIVTDPRLSIDVVNNHVKNQTVDSYLFDTYKAIATGGSSTKRGVFVYGWDEWITLANCMRRWLVRRALSTPEVGEGDGVHASILAGISHHISSALIYTFPMSGTHHEIPISLPLDQIVERLNAAQPVELLSYPSVIPMLAAEARAGRLKLKLSAIQSIGEPLTSAVVKMSVATWGIEPSDRWGCSEGAHAVPCGEPGGMHLPDDLVIIEPVDKNGRAVPPGVRADKFFLTNLYNLTVPLIRYEITDRILVLPQRCPCGSAYPRMASVEGRLDDLFVYENAVVHPFVFLDALEKEPNVVEYRVTQTRSGAHVEIHCRGPVDLSGLETAIAGTLRGAGVESPVVSIVVVDPLERTVAGKLKSFVALDQL